MTAESPAPQYGASVLDNGLAPPEDALSPPKFHVGRILRRAPSPPPLLFLEPPGHHGPWEANPSAETPMPAPKLRRDADLH